MRLTRPTNIVFWISTVLSALGLIGSFMSIPYVTPNAFWFVAIGNILLWLGVVLKDF